MECSESEHRQPPHPVKLVLSITSSEALKSKMVISHLIKVSASVLEVGCLKIKKRGCGDQKAVSGTDLSTFTVSVQMGPQKQCHYRPDCPTVGWRARMQPKRQNGNYPHTMSGNNEQMIKVTHSTSVLWGEHKQSQPLLHISTKIVFS